MPRPRLDGLGVVVMPSDATGVLKRGADYVCDGTADDVEIAAAIARVAGSTGVGNGGQVLLGPGKFVLSQAVDLAPGVEVVGAGMLRTWCQMVSGSYANAFELIGAPLYSGTATGGSTTTIEDTGKAWTVNALAGKYVAMVHGAGAGQVGIIASNTATELTFDAQSTGADNTTKYSIWPCASVYDVGVRNLGISWATATPHLPTVTSAAIDTLTDSSQSWATNALTGCMVVIRTGAQAGAVRIVESNTSTTVTLTEPLPAAPAVGDVFTVGGAGVVVWNQALRYLKCDNLYISPQACGIALTVSAPEARLEHLQVQNGLYGPNIALEATVYGRTGVATSNKAGQLTTHIRNSAFWSSRFGSIRIRPYVWHVLINANDIIAVDRYGSGVRIDGGGQHVVSNNTISSADTVTTLDSGTASAGANTTLTDAAKTWVVNAYVDATVEILANTGAYQRRIIISNTATELTVDHAWDVNPDNTSTYKIVSRAKAGVEITAGEAIVISGNNIATEQDGMVYGVRNVDGTGIAMTGNIVTGTVAAGFQAIQDDTGSEVTDTGNVKHTLA